VKIQYPKSNHVKCEINLYEFKTEREFFGSNPKSLEKKPKHLESSIKVNYPTTCLSFALEIYNLPIKFCEIFNYSQNS